MDPMTRFVAALKLSWTGSTFRWCSSQGQRKDEVWPSICGSSRKPEGVVFVGKAQEKTPVFRTEQRRNPRPADSYPWIVRSDGDGQPLLLLRVDRGLRPVLPQVLHLLPLQRQALPERPRVPQAPVAQEGIAFEALDNGVLRCADPRRCSGSGTA